jgi:K+-sensing histidine kinase KdpD
LKVLARRRAATLAGLIGPVAACAALVPFRDHFPSTDAALVLVAVIVAIAGLGSRAGGFAGTVSASIWFDFFLTKPYESFAIDNRPPIETTVLLCVIGFAVTELAV